MKIGVAITTIHPILSLPWLRKCTDGNDVRFFIACDKKTPDLSAIMSHTDVSVLTTSNQEKWKCSEALTWNSMARRNTAFLEALAWGADIVVAHDVDNYPLDIEYFNHFETILGFPFDGIEVQGAGELQSGHDGIIRCERWFDGGAYLRPPAKHRGFPIQRQHRPTYIPVTDRKVGVAAGLILNDPDVDATTRLEHAPQPHQVSLLAEAGMIVDRSTWTMFNTQNSAVIRELIPAWFLMPNVGRMDDIYASLVVQRVARERDYHVHFGQPFALQQRHPHDLIKDMRAEIDGYDNVVNLAALLDSIVLPGKSVIEDTRIIYQQLTHCSFIPEASARAGLIWLEDCAGAI